jgi:hypothetical protein
MTPASAALGGEAASPARPVVPAEDLAANAVGDLSAAP